MQTAKTTLFLCAENALASKNYFGMRVSFFVVVCELVYSVTTFILDQKFNVGATYFTPCGSDGNGNVAKTFRQISFNSSLQCDSLENDSRIMKGNKLHFMHKFWYFLSFVHGVDAME